MAVRPDFIDVAALTSTCGLADCDPQPPKTAAALSSTAAFGARMRAIIPQAGERGISSFCAKPLSVPI
jgi:hypothetical protein